MNEEPFGPVAMINPYEAEEDMIAEANRLPYGLAGLRLDQRCHRANAASPTGWKRGWWASTRT